MKAIKIKVPRVGFTIPVIFVTGLEKRMSVSKQVH